MLAFILLLLIGQSINLSWSTRLPLEVYELAPATVLAHQVAAQAAAAAAAAGAAPPTYTTLTTSNLNSNTNSMLRAATKSLDLKLQENSHHQLANKNLEYSIINVNQQYTNGDSPKLVKENIPKISSKRPSAALSASSLADDSLVNLSTKQNHLETEIGAAAISIPDSTISTVDQQLDRRRSSRQMMDEIRKNQQNLNKITNKNLQNHFNTNNNHNNNNEDPKQQQQQQRAQVNGPLSQLSNKDQQQNIEAAKQEQAEKEEEAAPAALAAIGNGHGEGEGAAEGGSRGEALLHDDYVEKSNNNILINYNHLNMNKNFHLMDNQIAYDTHNNNNNNGDDDHPNSNSNSVNINYNHKNNNKNNRNHNDANDNDDQNNHHSNDILSDLNVNKDVRILYQVGDSEEDLPVCAPNAVCSKIDLYETPWIERQCRCPPANEATLIIHHHHHQHQHQHEHQHHQHNHEQKSQKGHKTEENDVNKNLNSNLHSKYHSYYEKSKHLYPHKHYFVGDYHDKKFETMHLKKLMQKLGAVYEEDLHLQPNDIPEPNEAVTQPMNRIEMEIMDNDLPTLKKYSQEHLRTAYTTVNSADMHSNGQKDGPNSISYANNGAHMRHSGHLNHRPIAFIGGCPSSLGIEDGHTIADKTRHYKLCQPVHKLPVCRHFRDYTWTLTTLPEQNVTEQIVHCRCPKNSVTYLTKREPAADGSNGYNYLFACSPLTRIRCQRKQPCKLFTVRKRQEFLDEVNINSLCQCPKGHHCPSHHTQSAVVAGESFLEDNIQTFSGYCMAND